nr:glucan endo-1,3-beta-glucosidase, acidic isoform gi9 [Ipomoea batatas]
MGVRASESSKGKLQEAAAGTARKLANPMFSGGNRKSQPPTAPRWKMATRKEIRAVWRPAVPSWEKEFCLKATTGLFPTWDKFVEAKNYVHLYDNIMQWDDKEAQESFNRSKTLFYAKKFNIVNNLTLPDSDLYIDKIVWDDDDSKIDDSELMKELGPAIDEEEIEEINNQTTQSKRSLEIAIEDIKPTGWDVEPEEFTNANNLTGLIVGGHSPYWF